MSRIWLLKFIAAWDTAEPLTSSTALPPVNPWDVVPSEPVESTGWANFDNFENTLSIENTAGDDKKPRDELKEKTSETAAVDTGEKDITSGRSQTTVEGGDGKSGESVGGEALGGGTVDLPVAEADLNIKSDEDKAIPPADRNANPSNESPADRYFFFIIAYALCVHGCSRDKEF